MMRNLLVSLLCLIYVYIGYGLERSDFMIFIVLYALLFGGHLALVKYESSPRFLFCAGFAFRLVLLFALPRLSQDFYRFIWDGRLLLGGGNPYICKPQDVMQWANFYLPQKEILYEKMGTLSASHFSNYPPIHQLFFFFSALLARHSILGSVIVFKIIILCSDIGIYYFGRKILATMRLPRDNIFYYFLNPLTIIELTGNLHFEGVMLFFFLAGVYFLLQNQWQKSALWVALSISTKLLPLFFLPLFFQRLGLKTSILYYLGVIGLCGISFLPFLHQELLDNYTATLALWFVNFEFNASFYYVIREVGFYLKGYNIIQTLGRITPILMLLFILILSFLKQIKTDQQIFVSMLLVLTVYFLQSTTVHPWYILNVLLVGVFTPFRFPIVWSMVVVLSYSSYTAAGFQENFWVIGIEYSILFYSLYLAYIKQKAIAL